MVAYAMLRHHEDAQDVALETQYRIYRTLTNRQDLWRLYEPVADQHVGDRYTRQTAVNVVFDMLSKRRNNAVAVKALRDAYGIVNEEYRRPNQRKPAYEYELTVYERSDQAVTKRELLIEAVLALESESQRRRMLYVVIDGLNFAQIGQLEGVSEAAIRHSRDRATPHLVDWLSEWGNLDEEAQE